MKKILAALAAFMSVSAFAANPFEAGVFSPTQLNGPGTSVNGVRVGLVYTENRSVEGLDLNLIANKKSSFKGLSLGSFYDRTEGDFTGVRLGWFVPLTFNSVGGNMKGLQSGLLNIVEGDMTGIQFGGANLINTGLGAQVGLFNKAERIKGLQLGFVNMAKNLQGLQIGLVNIADNSQVFEVLPLVNFNFRF